MLTQNSRGARMTQGGEDTAITQVRHDGSFESGDDGYSEK